MSSLQISRAPGARIQTKYRRKYELYLGVFLPPTIHVHHLDHNRNNNEVENLVAIPAILHKQYHFWQGQYANYAAYSNLKMPSKARQEKFNYYKLMDGSWKENFTGTQREFNKCCDNVCYTMMQIERMRPLKKEFEICLKKVLKYKATQSQKSNRLSGLNLSAL